MVDSSTISSVVPFLIASVAGQAGMDAAAVLRAAGLEPPFPPDEHVPVVRYLDVWKRTMAFVKDPAFPTRAAQAFQLEDSEIFGFLAMSCETLGGAYERTAAYRALYSVGARWELQIEPDATRLIWYPWPGAPDVGYRAAMEYAVADMANSIRRLGRTRPVPRAVHFTHASPGVVPAYKALYGVEPTFGSALHELVYPPGIVDLPIDSFNSRLRDYFDEECKRMVSKLAGGNTLVDQVRKKLIAAMDGTDVTIEKMAKQLGMSPRSLQRRLADEGVKYNDLLAEVRAEFAKRYLARGTVTASEVAYLLGFTEPPAFFKAFKRWTGMTPRAFQLSAGAH